MAGGGNSIALAPNGATIYSGNSANDLTLNARQDYIWIGEGMDTITLPDPSQTFVDDYWGYYYRFDYPGYQFVKWNTVADNSGTSYQVGDLVSYEIGTLYAIWEPDSGGGDVTDTISVSYGDTKIHTATASETFTLNTEGKFMTDDIVIAPWVPDPDVDNNSWEDISRVASAGTAASYWSVGDTKKVHLQGTMGTLSLNTDLYVFIIGINHRDVNGITWQGFKTAKTSGKDVCLVDSYYNSSATNGSKRFNMNHRGGYNYGGWKGCDLRYDILGSTDTEPSGYSSTPTTSRVGYDASSTTATSPVSNTLMSCLPADLRAVMQPMTIYTDNKGNSSNTSASVTTSVDYLPLLAEYEVQGVRNGANQYEQNNQAQYAYYSAGNSKVKYRHSATSSTSYWWNRSLVASGYLGFCTVYTNGGASSASTQVSSGISPMFLVGGR